MELYTESLAPHPGLSADTEDTNEHVVKKISYKNGHNIFLTWVYLIYIKSSILHKNAVIKQIQ